jgi:hypothetical protein
MNKYAGNSKAMMCFMALVLTGVVAGCGGGGSDAGAGSASGTATAAGAGTGVGGAGRGPAPVALGAAGLQTFRLPRLPGI